MGRYSRCYSLKRESLPETLYQSLILLKVTGPTKKKWRSDREANRHGSLHAQPYSILKKLAIHLATNRDGSRAEVPPEKKWRALSCLRDHLKTSFYISSKIASSVFFSAGNRSPRHSNFVPIWVCISYGILTCFNAISLQHVT